jgi:ADP-heptose:LPS heptosyltransferase
LAKQHLLVFRFSSLGDVAMTVPVLRLLLKQHPHLEVTVVSTEFVRPLFNDIDRLQFHVADLKGKHKGVPGLYKLYKELKAYRFDGIADLHNVLRTKILRSFFGLSRKPIGVIDKGRKEKKDLTRQENKKLRPLKSTFQRYADVFHELGFEVALDDMKAGEKEKKISAEVAQLKKDGCHLIGIAPFALHAEKTYPAEKMKEVIRLLSQQNNTRLYLFGGKKEKEELEQWERGYSNVTSLAGKMSFEKELEFISGLDVMVSMDSANMHLASLYGVPVVSVWGGTHPYLGFYGWGQSLENAVQVDLDCRPSSVFGNKPCPRNMECMNLVSPIMVYEKIIQQLNR